MNTANMTLLDQPVSVITGAAGGIGRAVVSAMLHVGRGCIAIDKSARGLAQLRAENPSCADGLLQTEVVDLADVEAVQDCAKRLATSTSQIHSIVLCAAITLDGVLEETHFHDWNLIFGVNVTANYLLLRELLPKLQAQEQGGSIVGIGSVSSTLIGAGGGSAAYECSKAAFTQLIRAVAYENAAGKIRANIIAPAKVDTDFGANRKINERELFHGHPEHMRPGKVKLTPIGRAARAEEIADIVMFLTEQPASLLTGSVIMADGGYSLF